MQRAHGQHTHSRATEETGGTGGRGLGRAPPSPAIPPKRAKVTTELGGPVAPIFLQELQDTSVSIGQEILLRVAVMGSPQPHMSWYKDKVPLFHTQEKGKEEGNKENEEEYGCLRIRNSKADDAGIYRCVARNKHGEATSSATVTITDMEVLEEGTQDQGSCRWNIVDYLFCSIREEKGSCGIAAKAHGFHEEIFQLSAPGEEVLGTLQ
ncbi:hypothetical protein JRQ81_001966, partial [Phrynocephalus forsythii]